MPNDSTSYGSESIVPANSRSGYRAVAGAIRSVTSGVSAALAIPPNERRLALVISPPLTAGASVTISDDANVTLGGGLSFTSDGGRMTLTREQFGVLITRQLWAIASGAGVVWGYAEAAEQ